MKSKFLFLFAVGIIVSQLHAQVAINSTGSAPNSNAMLDVSSDSKGVLIPRLTSAQRTGMNLSTTETGLFVFDTDTNSFWYWDGNTWQAMGSNAVSEDKDWFVELTTTAPTDTNDDMYHLGNVAVGKNTADYKLDIYDTQLPTVLKVDNANTDNSIDLRTAGYFNVGGSPTTTKGKMAIYATVGGEAGDTNAHYLTGIETDVVGTDTNTKPQMGLATDVGGNNAASHTGVSNYVHNDGDGALYGVFNGMFGSGNGMVIGTYDFIANGGSGLHFGVYRRMGGNGNGVQYGAFNRIGNTGSGKHFGILNELKTTGASAHVGTANILGAGVPENNPSALVVLAGDSDGKRVGTLNTIAGDGSGLHIAESNNIFSTGDGFHIGVSNVLGHNYLTGDNTATNGYQLGILNNLTDTGGHAHVGSSNLLGYVLNPTDPANPVAVSGDSDAMRIGEMNTIGGDGNGQHYGIINTILSTGSGEHVGTSNSMGYNFATHTATTSSGDHVGTLNSLNDLGGGKHYGTVNFIGYDHINHTELDSDGLHFGTVNFLAGGQSTSEGIKGLQVGVSNVIIAKTDVTQAPFFGRQIGTLNIIGLDLQNPQAGNYNNGDGNHYATYNYVSDTGDGDHIASYNKVTNDGSGRHVAVYAEVDNSDQNAMAGVFNGDATARNYLSNINFFAGVNLTNDDNTYHMRQRYSLAVSPSNYHRLGKLQVKLVIKLSNYTGAQSDHSFRLLARQTGNNVTVIDDTDTWTWTHLVGNNYIIESQWKTWDAGTNPWLMQFQIKNDNNTEVRLNNVYMIIRPEQIVIH